MGIQQILLIVLSMIIVGVAIAVVVNMFNRDMTPDETHELVALSNSSEISGKIHGFFLMLDGTVERKSIYKCMIKYNGGYRMVELNPDYVTIYEITDSSIPRIVGEYSEYNRSFGQFKDVKVYIPSNSILNKFEIDVSK